MISYKYNELEYAKLIHDNGFQTKYKPTELRLLVLYYRDVLGYPPAKRELELKSFCQKYIPKYCYVKHYVQIDRALRQGNNKKQKLIVVEAIEITKTEFEYINALNVDYNYKKILFTLLVYNKLTDAVYELKNIENEFPCSIKGGIAKYKEIQSMANVPSSLKINEDAVNNLSKHNLITPLHNGIIELTFINNIVQSEDVLFIVKGYENIGWYFDFHNNVSGIKLCKECSQPFKAKSNRQEFCEYHIYRYNPINSKTLTCIDCGEVFETSSKSNKCYRCDKCKIIADKNKKKKWKNQQKVDRPI